MSFRLSIPALLTIGFTAGCSVWPSAEQVSAIDTHFKLQRLASQDSHYVGGSPGVRAYQKVLSQTLASQCRYFPSDSRYQSSLAARCGPLVATAKSTARFLNEYDAIKIGRSISIIDSKIHYVDLPDDCALF